MQRTCDSLVTIWWMQLLADWCGVCDGHALRAPRHAMSALPARFERVCVTVGLATFEPATFGRRLGWLLERRARYVCVTSEPATLEPATFGRRTCHGNVPEMRRQIL